MKARSAIFALATLGVISLSVMPTVAAEAAGSISVSVDCSKGVDEHQEISVPPGYSITWNTSTCATAYWDTLSGVNPPNGGVVQQPTPALGGNPWSITTGADAFVCGTDEMEFTDEVSGGGNEYPPGAFSYVKIVCGALPSTGLDTASMGFVGAITLCLTVVGVGLVALQRRRS